MLGVQTWGPFSPTWEQPPCPGSMEHLPTAVVYVFDPYPYTHGCCPRQCLPCKIRSWNPHVSHMVKTSMGLFGIRLELLLGFTNRIFIIVM